MRRIALTIGLLCALAIANEDEARAKAQAEEISRQLASRDADEKIAAARDAAQNQHADLTAPLIRLLKDKNPAVRIAAIEALQRRQATPQKKRASAALAARIRPLDGKEERRDELLKVLEALHDLAQPNALAALVDKIPPDVDRTVLRARLHAAANIPSKTVISKLLQIGSSGRKGRKNRWATTREALQYATQATVKGGVDQWRRWWSENKKTFDPVLAADQRAEKKLKGERRKRKRKKK